MQAFIAVLVFVVGAPIILVLKKVVPQISDNVAKQILTGIPNLWRICRFQRHYFEQLRYRHRYVPTKSSIQGRYPLELRQIFISSTLTLTSPNQVSSNPLKIPNVLRTGSHSLWDYLAAESLKGQPLVILGPPGSGKSTLLQDAVLTLVNRKERRQRPKVRYNLPFYLSLRNYQDMPKDNSSFSLADAIRAAVGGWGREIPQGWVENSLLGGRCLILLDGLDEIADQASRQRIAGWLQSQIAIYGHNNGFIVTSRPPGYDTNPLDGVVLLEILGFNLTQIREFIKKWYDTYYAKGAIHLSGKDKGASIKAEEDAQNLLGRLYGTPALFELAYNPLLLTLMTTIHQERGTLPGNRADLYKETCQVFLERRTRWEFPSGQKQKVLQKLAYEMMNKGRVEIEPTEAGLIIKDPLTYVSDQRTPEAFLQIVAQDGIWIDGLQPGTYRFAHKSFQEYLTAIYVRDNKQEQILVDHIGSSWWHETIFLYCTTGDATPILLACLKGDRLLADAVELALDLETHEKKIAARFEVREQFTRALSQAIEDEDPEKRHKLAKALLAGRTHNLGRMASIKDEASLVVDTSLITCAEYQLFLDEQQKHGHDYQPDHWKGSRIASGQGLTPALGIRPSDAVAFCNWLTEQDSSGIRRYRLPKSGELEREDEQLGKVGRLRMGSGYWIDEDTHFTWMGEKHPQPESMLLERLENAFKKDNEDCVRYLNSRLDDSILHESVTSANALLETRTIHNEIVHTLTSACKQILAYKRVLQAKIEEAQEEALTLQRQIKDEDEQEASQGLRRKTLQNNILLNQAALVRVQQEISQHQDRLKEAKQSVRYFSIQLENEHKRFFLLKKKNREQNLQEHLQRAQQSANEIQSQIEEGQQQERRLHNQITEAQREEDRLQYQSSSSNKGTRHYRLEQVRQDAKQCKDALKHIQAIYNICNRALTFSHTYGFSELFSRALSRNPALNLDHIFSTIEDETVINAPAYASDLAFAYAKYIAHGIILYTLDHIQSGISDQIQNMANDIVVTLTRAQGLASKLTRSHSSVDVQKLARYLFDYLEYLSKEENRSKIRESPLTRWYIRYFARVLVDHLLYWWWKEPPTKHTLPLFNNGQQENDTGEHIIDAYFDIYVMFTILEKRIREDSSFPPC